MFVGCSRYAFLRGASGADLSGSSRSLSDNTVCGGRRPDSVNRLEEGIITSASAADHISTLLLRPR